VWNFLLMLVDDPITPVLDGKLIGLTTVSVLLFIGSTIMMYLIKERLARIEERQKEDAEAIKGVGETLDKVQSEIENVKKEDHEQWAVIVEGVSIGKENNLRLHDLNETLDGIAHQQTQIATAQLNAVQTTQRVIDGLIQALNDHARD
jgi:hypothetical protein